MEWTIQYGSGDDCPVLGGTPQLINCPCQEFKNCVGKGIVPVCAACQFHGRCSLAPTQSCSLFQEM